MSTPDGGGGPVEPAGPTDPTLSSPSAPPVGGHGPPTEPPTQVIPVGPDPAPPPAEPAWSAPPPPPWSPTPGPVAGPFGGAVPPAGPPPVPPPARPPRRPEADRPRPRVGGTVAAVGGVLIAVGFTLLLDRLPGAMTQLGGLAWSIGLLVVGIAALVLLRGRAAITVGVALTALAVLPLVFFALVDPEDPEASAETLEDVKRNVALGLAFLAVGWFVGWLVGPGRRHAVYLGAALISAWLAVMVMVGVPDEGELFVGETFVPVGPTFDEEPFVDPFEDDPFDEEPPFADDVFGDDGFDEGVDEPSFDEPADPIDSGEIAGTSLAFGVAYAVAATVADRRRRRRTASAAWLASALALVFGLFFLADAGLEVWGASLAGIVVGGALLALGALGRHRFTAWNGGAVVITAFLVLVADRLGESTLVSGLVIMGVGIALAVAAALLGGDAGELVDEAPVPPAPVPTPAPVPAGSWAPPGASPPPPGPPTPGPPPPRS